MRTVSCGERLRHGGELPLIVNPFERERGVAVRIVRRRRDRHQPLDQLPPKVFVALAARQRQDVRRAVQPSGRRPPHPHVFVARRQLAERRERLLVCRNLVDGCRANGGVGVLPAGLRLESVEKRHQALSVALVQPLRFLRQPFGDLLAREAVVVVQVHDHRGERQPLAAPLRAPLGDLVQAPEQTLEMIGNQLAVIARQVIDPLVDRAEGARSALLVEVAAETLGPPARALRE